MLICPKFRNLGCMGRNCVQGPFNHRIEPTPGDDDPGTLFREQLKEPFGCGCGASY